MVQNLRNCDIHLLGFELKEVRALSEIANQLHWVATSSPGHLDCITLLLKHRPYLVMIEIDGIEHYVPEFVLEAKKAGVCAAFVCFGNLVPPGLFDQIMRAGVDLVLDKEALRSSDECIAGSNSALSTMNEIGVEQFISAEIAKKRDAFKAREKSLSPRAKI